MIGKVFTTRDIPAGACIYYDTEKNGLGVFDPNPRGEEVFVVAMPFACETTEPDERIWL